VNIFVYFIALLSTVIDYPSEKLLPTLEGYKTVTVLGASGSQLN